MTDVRHEIAIAVRTVASGAVRVRALLLIGHETPGGSRIASALGLPSLLLLGLALPRPSAA